jgi:hypothetical protein
MRSGGSFIRQSGHGALASLLLWMLATVPALADHVPGATYTGQTSAGGSVTVVVTPDGAAIGTFSVNDIRSQNCPNSTLSIEQTSYQPTGLAPIQEHRFSKTLDGGAIAGSFLSGGRAEGTVRWTNTDTGGKTCETAQLTWTATTTAKAPAAPPAVAAAVGPSPFCETEGQPTLDERLADLKTQIGAAMGDPAECSHADPTSGDTLQTTSTGLAILRAASGVPTFTDGGHRWGLVDGTLVAWEGDALDPPDDARAVSGPIAFSQPATPTPTPMPRAPIPPTLATPTRVPPTPTPRSATVADATYQGKTSNGYPVRIDTSPSGRTVEYFDFGDDDGKRATFSTTCRDIKGKMYWMVARDVAYPINSDGSFSFTLKGEDQEYENRVEVNGRFNGETVNGTLRWVFPKRRGCDSDTLSWSAKI